MNAIRAANDIPLVSVVLEELKKKGYSSKRLEQASFFIHAFFARITSTDADLHTAAGWADMLASLLDFLKQRTPQRPVVRFISAVHSARSAVDIVTDDMPFLVDTVSIILAEYSMLHLVLHPVVKVCRDAQGHLQRMGGDEGHPESVMHFEVDSILDETIQEQLVVRIEEALDDVRAAVRDWGAMREKARAIAADLPNRQMPLDEACVNEASEFLRWLAEDNFTFLGYREYEVVQAEGDEVLRPIEASGLGILHKSERSLAPRSLRSLAAHDLPQSGSYDAIILTKTNARSHVHRAGNMDYVGVLKFDANGMPISEQRFLGLFTTNAYMTRPQEVPLVRQRVEAVLVRSGLKRDAYSGKVLRHILETLPPEELFQSTEDELLATAMGILELKQRARTRLFLRRDRYGRFFTCLIFVPRERFNTTVRERIEAMLREAFHGESLDSNLLIGESVLVRLHVTVRPHLGDHPKVNAQELETRLQHIVRNWYDVLRDNLTGKAGQAQGVALFNRFGKLLPAGYIEEVAPEQAALDVMALTTLKSNDSIHLHLYEDARDHGLHLKLIHVGAPISLSDALPMLENMGVRMLAEHVYTVESEGRTLTIHDFELKAKAPLAFDLAHLRDRFERAFEALWRGEAESDGFNNLVLLAQADWRQVAMLRGYCKYLQQVGIAFSQSYMEETLIRYPAIAGLLIELFLAKFDPRRELLSAAEQEKAQTDLRRQLKALVLADTQKAKPEFIDGVIEALEGKREQQVHVLWQALKALLDDVDSLDDERIVLSFMNTIRATLRTSFFQLLENAPRPYISFKFDSKQVPDAPKPVPYREIFVYSPRVEGIHLRFGPVARGGLRWSDRREDFRTEVLSLVKAQMVKNTVIVPVGSKGGFFVKHPPASGDRDAQLAEGIACYRLFINGLLDITDNLVEGKIVPPHDVVRHDNDDPYLVVAADKGTATFSDIANAIAIEHGFWLGDAFASGGSNGYDHKRMGITAKGAWESVKRHFRALGRDCQSEDFTCVGIGDMSGDVFGNGMLLSRHIRLVAAFDHRHIFLDPNPHTLKSFAERERMFKLSRSSWEDYDKTLISTGGGVWPRSVKSIPISPEVRAVLGIDAAVEQLAPTELISAILKAPVDLLWNGGIGTYVKATTETHAEVGDRANNALRIQGTELRCKIVGEGGNLGLTQKGRIEAAQHGVLLNTDFIDNSAGVDTSDHEVNIKILLGEAVQRGEISLEDRNRLLASMTDEVGQLVLWDNYRQNVAITLMERQSVKRIGSMTHFIRTLESEGLLDRQVESLPSEAELTDRKTRGQGLTRPELAVLLSYDKIRLYQQLLESDVPEDPYLSKELVRYFPKPLHDKYAASMQRHRLKREIIATAVTNSTINRMGATFVMRMQEDTGQGPAAVAKAYTAAREILGARELWAEIEAQDSKVAETTQVEATLQVWAQLRHLTRWLLNHRGGSLEIAANVERYQGGVAELSATLPDALTMAGKADFATSQEKWEGLGLPRELALRLVKLPALRAMLDMVEVAQQSGEPTFKVANVFYELGQMLGLEWLRGQIEALPVEGHWHAQARGSLLEELGHQHRALAMQVLTLKGDKGSVSPVQAWLERDDPKLKYTRSMLAEILTQNVDYPIASVAVRRLAQLAHMPV